MYNNIISQIHKVHNNDISLLHFDDFAVACQKLRELIIIRHEDFISALTQDGIEKIHAKQLIKAFNKALDPVILQNKLIHELGDVHPFLIKTVPPEMIYRECCMPLGALLHYAPKNSITAIFAILDGLLTKNYNALMTKSKFAKLFVSSLIECDSTNTLRDYIGVDEDDKLTELSIHADMVILYGSSIGLSNNIRCKRVYELNHRQGIAYIDKSKLLDNKIIEQLKKQISGLYTLMRSPCSIVLLDTMDDDIIEYYKRELGEGVKIKPVPYEDISCYVNMYKDEISSVGIVADDIMPLAKNFIRSGVFHVCSLQNMHRMYPGAPLRGERLLEKFTMRISCDF